MIYSRPMPRTSPRWSIFETPRFVVRGRSSCVGRQLTSKQEPKLWYGIGILYDRYGSLEHAEEAFSQVMQMQPDFEKANEIYFRLGIIYKQQQKYNQSLEVGLLPVAPHSRAVCANSILSASNTLSTTLRLR